MVTSLSPVGECNLLTVPKTGSSQNVNDVVAQTSMAPTCVCDFSRYGVLNRPQHTKPVMYCTYVDESDWVVNRISGEYQTGG